MVVKDGHKKQDSLAFTNLTGFQYTTIFIVVHILQTKGNYLQVPFTESTHYFHWNGASDKSIVATKYRTGCLEQIIAYTKTLMKEKHCKENPRFTNIIEEK